MQSMKDVDIILPVYNEKKALEIVLREWSSVMNKLHISYVFIVCEDGSTDGTKDVLSVLHRKYSIILNQRAFRRGYGPPVIDGINISHSKYILSIDSDGQCDPDDFLQFWKKRNRNTVLIGWRVKRADALSRILYSKLFKIAFGSLFPGCPHDPSAPYVLFRKEMLLPHMHNLTLMREGFWWGFVGTCMKFGIPIEELPIHHRERIDGKTQVYTAKKVPLIAIRNIIGLIKLRFVV